MIKKQISIRYSQKFLQLLRYLLMPGLLVLFYLLFHYANNVMVVSLIDLTTLILPALLIALVVYLFFFLVFYREPARAGIAAVVFLVFFLLYGVVYTQLKNLDLFWMAHHSFLPLYIITAIYIALMTTLIGKKNLGVVNLVGTVILAGLIVVNLARIVPVEVTKFRLTKAAEQETVLSAETSQNEKGYPDIYYIVFDEAAGFDVIRDFFDYPEVDEFVSFLEENQFYLADNSQTRHAGTLYSMASRLNYSEFETDEENTVYFEAITQNKVMTELKKRGYTTVVFSEINEAFGFAAMPDIASDYTFDADAEGIGTYHGLSGELGQLIINQSMLAPLASRFRTQDPLYEKHQKMINLTREKIVDLREIPAPRFVYVHLMLPHSPFMFDRNGNLNDRKKYYDYNYYLDNYLYSLSVAQEMVNGILASADPDIPPVIIIQSDHGCRNIKIDWRPFSDTLKDYPGEYNNHILNAIRLPDCPDAPLTQDMNPIDTFPIIFNCLFDAGIPLQ